MTFLLEQPARSAGSRAAGAGWFRRLAPSLSDFLFVFFLAWPFLLHSPGWSVLLEDGDTGWHIRAGEIILDQRAVPRSDPFSFSKPGAGWFAWEWLADALMAVLHRAFGLKGIVLAAGVTVALFGTLLLRFMLWRGASPLIALPVTLLCFGASSVHYLARPHLFTLIFLVAALWLIEEDRRAPTCAVWLLVPLTGLWANLHGGFPVLLVVLGSVAAGGLIESWWGHAERAGRRRQAWRYLGIAGAALGASLVNPYGWELHRHIAGYLRSDWIRTVVEEFQSPSFRQENVLQYETLLLAGLGCAGCLLARQRAVEALWILVGAHLSLGAVRHIPVYAILAGPLIAVELSRWWAGLASRAEKGSTADVLRQFDRDLQPGFRRSTWWPAVFVLLLAAGVVPAVWPADFPESRFPVGLIAAHQDRIRGARLFTHDQWGDYLIYRLYPEVKVFMDGRTDFYGPQIGDDYIALLGGRPGWLEILGRYRFDLVLIPADAPLASLLGGNAGWELVDQTAEAVLYSRRRP